MREGVRVVGQQRVNVNTAAPVQAPDTQAGVAAQRVQPGAARRRRARRHGQPAGYLALVAVAPAEILKKIILNTRSLRELNFHIYTKAIG